MTTDTAAPDTPQPKNRLLALIGRSEIPLAVYCAIFSTMAILWIIQEVHEDLTLGLFTELLGAAFTLFIIDTLLVRAKDKRWKAVRNHVDYLIGRNVNRLRDGVATRVFRFDPAFDEALPEQARFEAIRAQRAALLSEVATLEGGALLARVNSASLFSEDAYVWFNEKADDLWEVINMKYSEYLPPELVSLMIRLHTQLKDVCAHIRQFRKAETFPDSADYYRQIGRMGMSVSLQEVIALLNTLKASGYSEVASLAGGADLADSDSLR